MGYLKDHQPSLVHGSPFLWTIYLDRDEGGWHVTKIMDLNDVLWWDPAYDLAFLRFLPFGQVGADRWEAFRRGYGPVPQANDMGTALEQCMHFARKRLLLYAIEQRFCAAMGAYQEPQSARNKAWAERCLEDVDAFLDEIEG